MGDGGFRYGFYLGHNLLVDFRIACRLRIRFADEEELEGVLGSI